MADAPARSSRRRWIVRALVLAVVVAVLAWRRSRRLAQGESPDPCGPAGSTLPAGEERVVRTPDGAQLAVLVAGPADGATVVLPHCWTGSRRIWGAVARRLVELGHRVVLYDQRGHAESTSGEEPPSVEVLGDDLRLVMEEADARDAVLVGHSMGGMTVQSYAIRHPEDFAKRTRAVVLVATAARVLGRAVPAALIERALGEGRAEWTRRGRVGRAVIRGSLGREARRSHIDLTLECFAGTPGAARAGYLTAMAPMDLRHGLSRIDVPTTVLVGSRDLLTPPRLSRQMADAIPGARLEVLPGMGHMLPLEAPERVVEAVTSTTQLTG